MRSSRMLRVLLAVLPLLAACSPDPNKVRVVGKREDVLPEATVPTPDAPSDLRVVLPAPDAVPDWPQAGGFTPHAMLHLALGANPQRVWRASIGAGDNKRIAFVDTPIVARGVVYVMDANATVSAFRLSDGHRYWRVALAPRDVANGSYGGGLAYDGGKVYATTGYGQLVVVDGRTGRLGLRINLPAPVRGAPTVRAGRVLVQTVANQTVAYDVANGQELWRHSGNPEPTAMLGGSSPAIDGNTVVVAYSSGEIYGLRIENGTVLWSDQLSVAGSAGDLANLPDIRGLPVIEDGRVFAAGNAGTFAAFDLQTGRRLWDRNTGSLQTPWVAGDFVYLLTNAPAVLCFQASTGKLVWARALPAFGNPTDRTEPIVWTGPVLGSNRLIVAASNGEAVAISPYSGNVLGIIKLPAGVEVAPIIANRSLLFLTEAADLVVYR